jgi:hypothetical protein
MVASTVAGSVLIAGMFIELFSVIEAGVLKAGRPSNQDLRVIAIRLRRA